MLRSRMTPIAVAALLGISPAALAQETDALQAAARAPFAEVAVAAAAASVGVDVDAALGTRPAAGTGTSGRFLLTPVATPPAGTPVQEGQIEARRGERPPSDQVGGFQLSIFGGVQLRGSASGTGGIALGYFNRRSASRGLEFEAAFTRGPTGEIYHGLLSIVLQSGARSARLVPFLTLGGGIYRAHERLRPTVRDALPEFGVDPVEKTETGPLMAIGFGIRYYLGGKTSFRADYREFRALTTGDGGFWDRLYALRRIAGFFSFEF